jgi:tryptophan synthase alpha subunit
MRSTRIADLAALVRELAAVADGVVVGSALVSALRARPATEGPQRVASLVAELSQAAGRNAVAMG